VPVNPWSRASRLDRAVSEAHPDTRKQAFREGTVRSLGLALGLSLGLATGAWAADPAAERAKLQGTWRAVAAERNGAPAPDVVGHDLTFLGDRFRITRDGGLLYGGAYTIDPSAEPSRIDFQQDEGADLRGTWKGIYRLDGGRLEIVDNAPDMGKPAPTQFAAGPGSGYVLVQFVPR
jgi:uncharacterized protein (TIGR03067 family)